MLAPDEAAGHVGSFQIVKIQRMILSCHGLSVRSLRDTHVVADQVGSTAIDSQVMNAGLLQPAGNCLAAANGPLKGILRAADEPLVSTDIIGENHSSIVDLELISQVAPNFFRVVSWYDNENSYSVRCVDLLAYMAEKDNS